MKTEIYLCAERYARLVNHVLTVLPTHRRTLTNPGIGTRHDLQTALHEALRGAGVDPAERPALVEALTDLQTSFWNDDFDACDIKIALGELGDVWPNDVREDDEPAKQAA